jgi:hypothetical protein
MLRAAGATVCGGFRRRTLRQPESVFAKRETSFARDAGRLYGRGGSMCNAGVRRGFRARSATDVWPAFDWRHPVTLRTRNSLGPELAAEEFASLQFTSLVTFHQLLERDMQSFFARSILVGANRRFVVARLGAGHPLRHRRSPAVHVQRRGDQPRWTSGNVSATQPQRWAAQPFTLPAGNWHITQIAPEWFTGTGVNTALGYKIWNRVGQVAPAVADEVVSGFGNVVLDGDPIITNFVLPGGDYYLTVFSGSPQGNTIGWFTNAPNGIHFIDPGNSLPFMWRGTTYPPPSWVVYQLAATALAPANGSDPNKLYCSAFRILGEPAPVSYCTAGVSAAPNFCVPSIGSVGYPRVSQAAGFTVSVSNMPSQRTGILFYGTSGRAANPWGQGPSFFCVVNPVQRMSVLTSSGNSNCDGVYGEDWLLYEATHPALWAIRSPRAPWSSARAGTAIRARGKNTNYSNALEWTCLP